jgi:hypothetical protein
MYWFQPKPLFTCNARAIDGINHGTKNFYFKTLNFVFILKKKKKKKKKEEEEEERKDS